MHVDGAFLLYVTSGYIILLIEEIAENILVPRHLVYMHVRFTVCRCLVTNGSLSL